MTRQKRLRRTLAFTYVMAILSCAAFVVVPSVGSLPGAMLAFHSIFWAVLASSTHAELAKIRLGLVINDTKGGAIDQGN